MKSRSRIVAPKKLEAEELFLRADKNWDQGRLDQALSLFKAAAEAGEAGALLNVGYFYQNGLGVRRNSRTALHWYKRAYQRGDGSAANNIGTIWRDKNQPRRALLWFKRATELGNDSSNLEIAKYYLQIDHDPQAAVAFLKRVRESKNVSEADVDAAEQLLREAGKVQRKARRPIG